MIDGSECEDLERLENEIINYYKQLYSKNTRTKAWFTTWEGKQISCEQAAWLERQFEEVEIKTAVFSLAADKAPGPDGFKWLCSKNAEIIIKVNLIDLSQEFHMQGEVSRGLNSNFITLIPKKRS